jgi:hypothetical protein
LKIAENTLDYSLGNTSRQALWLLTSRDEKYQIWTRTMWLLASEHRKREARLNAAKLAAAADASPNTERR